MKYKFLIYISYSYALPIGEPIEKEILNRNDEVKWFSDLPAAKEKLKHKENLLEHIDDVLNYQPDIVLTATDNVPDFITGIKVQIFHGFNSEKRPDKKIGDAHFRLRGFFDLYCTQGPNTTDMFQQLQKEKQYFEVVETGWSKVDPLFPIEQKEKTNTIMIASTFTERLSLAYDDGVYQEIKRLSENEVFNFIMVLHPKLPDHIIQKWKSINNSNFTFYDTTDLIPLFKKADVMFADTTSAIQEFLIQKKPVVTYKHTFEHDYLINVTEPNNIETALKEGLNPSNHIINSIGKFIANLHPYNDGNSSKRVIEACINFLHKDKSHLKNKPLNLIRKFKIRKQLNYFTLKSYNKPYTLKKSIQNNIKISALIITYNEEKRIENLINNLSFVDEIVIVDSFSNDNTIDIIKRYPYVKIVQNKFLNFSNQRNFALTQVSNDWILFIDADELIPEKLKKEIIDTMSSKTNVVAFETYRQFYFKDKPLRFSGWQTDKVFRLFNKNFAQYEPTKLVHETLNIKGNTSVLKNKLAHYSYINYEDYKSKMNKYAHLRALELFKKKLKPNFYHLYLKPLYRFFNHFVIRLGFLDGKNGYTICKLSAYGVKQRYVELLKLYNKN